MDVVIPVLGLMTSTMMVFVSLWQVEIVSWNQDEEFEFPFFILAINKWWARDFWYAVNVIGWVLGILSGYALAGVI